MNLANLIVEGIQKFGEYDLFTYIEDERNTVLSNVEIDRRAQALAAGLIGHGVVKGDIVGVCVGNIKEIPELMNGTMRMGAAFLPIIFMLTPKEIRYILEDSQAKILITEMKQLAKIREATEGNKNIKKIVVIGLTEGEGDEKIVSYEAFKQQDSPALGRAVLDLDPDDLAILMYTSGSTGFPKGVMLTHNNLISILLSTRKVWPYDTTDIFYTTVPMNHIYGVTGLNQGCYSGAKLLLVPWFDPVKTLDIITDYKATVAGLVPTMIIRMMEKYDPSRHSLKHMKRLVSSGAPLAEETLAKAQELFGVKLFHGYGCTESASTIALQVPEWEFKMGSVGPAIPGLALRLVDDDDNDVPAGASGEIIVKGPNVMKGYWNKPRETAETLRDGWLHTGDLGKLDEKGELYIVGRKKDLIIKGGENIDPGVSENILLKHPAVVNAATIAIPDSHYGEEVASAVILKSGEEVTEKELLEYVGKQIHHFVAPKRIFILSEFPTTGTGKVLKREIREIVKGMMK